MKNDKDRGKKKKKNNRISPHLSFQLDTVVNLPLPYRKKEPAESSLFLKVLFSDHLLMTFKLRKYIASPSLK